MKWSKITANYNCHWYLDVYMRTQLHTTKHAAYFQGKRKEEKRILPSSVSTSKQPRAVGSASPSSAFEAATPGVFGPASFISLANATSGRTSVWGTYCGSTCRRWDTSRRACTPSWWLRWCKPKPRRSSLDKSSNLQEESRKWEDFSNCRKWLRMTAKNHFY